MCFSAGASFGASGVLVVTGVIAISKARDLPQRLFATIPLIFALQQLSEGLLWLAVKHAAFSAGQPVFTYFFLVFAWAVWPVWIPFTIRLLEKDVRRKRILTALLGIGIMVSLCVVIVLLKYPVEVISMQYHIHYHFDLPGSVRQLAGVIGLAYFLAAVVPAFISSQRRMTWLGIAFSASYLFAMIFYPGFVVSVWCFFAAVLSMVVAWIISGLKKS